MESTNTASSMPQSSSGSPVSSSPTLLMMGSSPSIPTYPMPIANAAAAAASVSVPFSDSFVPPPASNQVNTSGQQQSPQMAFAEPLASSLQNVFSQLQAALGQQQQQQQSTCGGPMRVGNYNGSNNTNNFGQRKRRPLWKLVRSRYTPSLSFRLCSRCNNSLYRNPHKAVEMDGGCAQISFVLCPICVDRNMLVSDAMAGQQHQAAQSDSMMPMMGEENAGMETNHQQQQ
jgi:hypothetical protein